MEPRCPEGVETTWTGQGIVFEPHLLHCLLPSRATGFWSLGSSVSVSTSRFFPVMFLPGSKGKGMNPENKTSTVGAVQWVLGGGAGVGLQGLLWMPLSCVVCSGK